MIFHSSPSADVIIGGDNVSDVVFTTAENLSSADVIDLGGGAGVDILRITSGGALAADALGNVSNVERIVLNAAGTSIAVGETTAKTTDADLLQVIGRAGNDVIDGSAVTNSRLWLEGGSGDDVLTGGGGNDVIFAAAADLTGADQIDGGTGLDILRITSGGALAADALDNVTNVERILLKNVGNGIVIGDAIANTTDRAFLQVIGRAGNDVIDGSAVTNARLWLEGGSGDDTVTGGGGDDVIWSTAANLTGADQIGGGAGVDVLKITSAGALASDALDNVTSVERILLKNVGNSIAIGDATANTTDAAFLQVIGRAGNDVIDGSAVTNARLWLQGGGGDDVVTGGDGNDVIWATAGSLTGADQIGGGAGIDVLRITTGGALAADALDNVTNVERLVLSASGNTLTVSDALDGTGDLQLLQFTVAGGITDTLRLSDSGTTIDLANVAATGIDRILLGSTLDTSDNLLRVNAGDVDSASVVAGGAAVDTIEFVDAGIFDFGSAGLNVSGVEKVVIGSDATTLGLNVGVGGTGGTGYEVSLGGASHEITSGAGDDTFVFDGAFAGETVTINSFQEGTGNDVLSLGAALQPGSLYGGEFLDDTLAKSALVLWNVTFSVATQTLFVDVDRSELFNLAEDFAVVLPGVNDLTVGSDLIL